MRSATRRVTVAGMATMAMLMSVLVVSPAVPAIAASTEVVFDDMEHGNPFGNGWFAFSGSVGGGGIGPNSTDLPPANGGTYSLETGWGSGGVPGFYGGFGRTNPADLTDALYFNFWISPDPGQDYTLEINLQEDDNGDGAINQPDDDEFQFNCVVSPTGPCAVSGGGWQSVSIALADFLDDNSFLFGGNGVLDPVPVSGGGNGQLINVVIAVIGNSGSDATFRTDDWVFSSTIIDDFEGGLSAGFFTFSDGSPVSIGTSATPPDPVPISLTGNTVLQMDANVTAFAGFIHAFESSNPAEWVSQNWSESEGFSFWLYGSNSDTDLFIDLLENRNPGSTTDDAERWTVTFKDDFSGWKFFQFPFSDFVRKEIGTGAPNDGLTLFEVHGWAFGTLDTGGPATYWMDDVSLYGLGLVPDLQVNFAAGTFNITEGTTGNVTVRLNRPMLADDPAIVSVDYNTEPGTAQPGRDFTSTSGTLTFTNGGPQEQTFSIETFGDDKFLGSERVVLRLSNPVDVELGTGFQSSAIIIDDDPFDPRLLDDFERGAYLWDSSSNVTLWNPEYTSGDPMEVPGQGTYESVLRATVLSPENIEIQGRICNQGTGVIPVRLRSTNSFDATAIDHTTVRLGAASEAHVDRTGEARRHQAGDDVLFHFRFEDTGLPCDPEFVPLTGLTFDGEPITGQLWRDFPLAQDWSRNQALSFWYHGTGSGDEIGVMLKDNTATDPGPSGWVEVWSDEFDGSAGTPPNPDNWTHEIGDVTPDGKNGWGNSELQYYTDDPANASHDGDGNLVITLREADGSLDCYYGPCEYTSARLLSWHKAELGYGRVESRLKLPAVGDNLDGLWPAFWSLGTDIDRNPWPSAGEIDVMEWVGRIPNEIFGTIHGPGYSGGASFGDTSPLADLEVFHTFAVEWEPNEIRWYLDDVLYHRATPADVAPNQWVFDKPFFMLLNFAIGGNFGGEVGDDVLFPQEYLVDYVRLYAAPETAERWDSSFADDFVGWQEVTVPFDSFARSLSQPVGAPDDGLGLEEVWGYGFSVPGGGTLHIDQVRLVPIPLPPGSATVIDDFEDGNASDWGFFGGNAAGGGGGVAEDRPREGSYYFSTGWGGDGSGSGFYGGAFKNFDNLAQVTPPADPWFNVWVLNQSNATVDQYTLEITIREDTNGNGWTNGVEDSFRLDTVFPASSFNDEWTLISAPLSDFANLFTGGDGVFNGNLDEVVIVVSGVQGGPGSNVELDFDLFAFTSGGPLTP